MKFEALLVGVRKEKGEGFQVSLVKKRKRESTGQKKKPGEEAPECLMG